MAQIRCALDTNFLIDLASNDSAAITIHRLLLDRGVELITTNMVRAELENLVTKKSVRALALRVFENMSEWQIGAEQISPLKKGYIQEFRELLIKEKILDEREKHDGEIIGEASFAGADFLLTSDNEMINADQSVLVFHLKNQHMQPVNVVSKKVLFQLLKSGRPKSS
jgi:rRNA-processing protein FCF1